MPTGHIGTLSLLCYCPLFHSGTHLLARAASFRGNLRPARRRIAESGEKPPRPSCHARRGTLLSRFMSEGPQDIHPVTEVFTWRVAPGKQEEFESWAHGITGTGEKSEGHLGAAWLRSEGDGSRYHTVVRFTSARLLAQWLHSPER